MKRDFSEQQKQNLLNMVAEVQPDGVFENLKDWFDDTLLSILNNRYGILGYTKYLSDLDFYHRCMIDKDDVSADKINEIFANSLGVECNYKVYLQGNLVSISTYSNLLRQYYSCISVDNSSFSSKSAVGTIQKNELYDGYRSLYIKNYQYAHKDYKTSENGKSDYINVFEAVYPEHKEHMNTFFEPIKDEHQTDIDNIKFIVYSADEPYRSMFLDNVENAQWGNTAPYEITENGQTKTISGFASFNSNSNTINIDLTDEELLFKDPRGSYGSFFHEFGHYLDFTYGDNSFYTDNYVDQNNCTIDDHIREDVQKIVGQKVRETFPKYSEKQVNEITNRLINGNLPDYADNDSNQVRKDAIKVQKNLYKELDSAKKNGVSDSYDSATNYLRDSASGNNVSKKTGKGVAGSYQHDDLYYYEYDENGDLVKTTHSGGKESFANYFSTRIRNSEIGYDAYKEYLPDTTKEFDAMIKQMTGM